MGLRGLLSFYLLHYSNIPSFQYSLIEDATAQINSYDFTNLYKFRDVNYYMDLNLYPVLVSGFRFQVSGLRLTP